ncbi:DNRLRE domain-containing protein [Candidatus Dojkabacteria bacterium]|nr:DNRLRE domain-containing protein [Candidatus Dojkabacteria bacterium]
MRIKNIFFLTVIITILFYCIFPQGINAEDVIIPISQDTYVEEGFPTISPWNNRNFYVGYDTYYTKKLTNSFIKADFSDISDLLPKDIISAKLNIYMYEYEGTNDTILYAYIPSTDWQEQTLNWNNQPSPRTLISQTIISPTITWKSIDITDYVKTSILYDHEDKGLLLKLSDQYNPAAIFWSISCLNTPTPYPCEPYQKPYISITYKPNNPPYNFYLLSPENNIHTNNTNMIFRSQTTTDPDNEEVSYKLELAIDTDFKNIMYQSNLEKLPFFYINNIEENNYFWRVIAFDEHGGTTGQTKSNIYSLTVDITSPSVPEIIIEPPFTNGNSNQINWRNSKDNFTDQRNIDYQAQISLSKEFSEIFQQTEWEKSTSATFSNLNDGQTYYYRVFARDSAGNISQSSETTKSTQDSGIPQIKKFNIAPVNISPSNTTSKGENDFAQIEVMIEDPTLKKIELVIVNDKHEKTFGKITSQSENFEWPINPDVPDGSYFAYLEATDQFDHKARSESIRLYIDNVSPAKPVIHSPINNHYYNTNSVQISLNVELGSSQIIYLNDMLNQYLLGNETPKNAYANEGINKFTIVSKDLAQNKSNSTVNFVVDTIPPQKPEFSLEIDNQSRTINMYIDGEIDTLAYIFVNGIKLTPVKMARPQEKIQIIHKYADNTTYSVFTYLEDKALNKSPYADTKEIKTPPQKTIGIGSGFDNTKNFPQIPKLPKCTAIMHKDNNSFHMDQCKSAEINLSEVINKGKNTQGDYTISIYGALQPQILLQVDYYRCKAKSFLDPRTWFTCIDEQYDTSKTIVQTKAIFYPKIKDYSGTIYESAKIIDPQGYFQLNLVTHSDQTGKQIAFETKQIGYASIENIWIKVETTTRRTNVLSIPKSITPNKGKFFTFIFNRLIGVTQWHGYTAYQSPHMGIDFGSVNEKIISPADGYIKAVGWDSYYGQCFSGGNFVRIEHDNGMNTVYFHLANYKKNNGTNWSINERIRKGEIVGTSGNTGAWNCQALGYHLHFELRQNRNQSTHVNPVPYIDTDWNQIPTLGWQQNPGRLTGDNPHPGY